MKLRAAPVNPQWWLQEVNCVGRTRQEQLDCEKDSLWGGVAEALGPYVPRWRRVIAAYLRVVAARTSTLSRWLSMRAGQVEATTYPDLPPPHPP